MFPSDAGLEPGGCIPDVWLAATWAAECWGNVRGARFEAASPDLGSGLTVRQRAQSLSRGRDSYRPRDAPKLGNCGAKRGSGATPLVISDSLPGIGGNALPVNSVKRHGVLKRLNLIALAAITEQVRCLNIFRGVWTTLGYWNDVINRCSHRIIWFKVGVYWK